MKLRLQAKDVAAVWDRTGQRARWLHGNPSLKTPVGFKIAPVLGSTPALERCLCTNHPHMPPYSTPKSLLSSGNAHTCLDRH